MYVKTICSDYEYSKIIIISIKNALVFYNSFYAELGQWFLHCPSSHAEAAIVWHLQHDLPGNRKTMDV